MNIVIPLYLIYPLYTGVISVVAVAIVPREAIKRLMVYSVTFGALADIALILLFSNVLGLGGHQHYQPFGVLSLPFFPPLAWTIWFIIYFYFLPKKFPWIIFYVLAATAAAVSFANVLVNFGVFETKVGRIVVPFLIYGTWFVLATWGFRRYSSDT